MRPLIVIPTFVRTEDDLAMTMRCMGSVSRYNQGDYEMLVVDDGSPMATEVLMLADRFGFNWHGADRNAGFSATVNVGLKQAYEAGRDAILMNADVEVDRHLWHMGFRGDRAVADVQGAVLLFPGEPALVQHGGVYFSVLRREFDHIHRYAPADLPNLAEAKRCPVTGALMQISAETMDQIGFFDETFKMGWEDLDYCIRTFQAGLECRVNPAVRAVHHEGVFRDTARSDRVRRWTQRSWQRLWEKHSGGSFGEYVPTMLGVE